MVGVSLLNDRRENAGPPHPSLSHGLSIRCEWRGDPIRRVRQDALRWYLALAADCWSTHSLSGAALAHRSSRSARLDGQVGADPPSVRSCSRTDRKATPALTAHRADFVSPPIQYYDRSFSAWQRCVTCHSNIHAGEQH